MDATVAGPIDLAGFRAEAWQLLAHQVPPEEVHWIVRTACDPARPQPAQDSRPRNVPRAAAAIVPASFQRLCELVVLHRDPQRFALLYRLLWRLVHEPQLRGNPVDGDMLHAQHLGHAVRRDLHKMKANLRMRAVHDTHGEEWQMGSYEPTHHIVEALAPWLAKRIAAPRWTVFTPERSLSMEMDTLSYGEGQASRSLPGFDAPDAEWMAVHVRVFTAAREPWA